ncbi:unnamed protein product, partial [Rotaria sp. Silwood1]
TYCPKANTSSILLSDKELEIWEQSKTIEDNDKEFIDTILSRYGFTEEYTISMTTLQRYGIRLYQDQLIAPLH